MRADTRRVDAAQVHEQFTLLRRVQLFVTANRAAANQRDIRPTQPEILSSAALARAPRNMRRLPLVTQDEEVSAGYQYASAIQCQAPAQTRTRRASQTISRYTLRNPVEIDLRIGIGCLQRLGQRSRSEPNVSRSASWLPSMGSPMKPSDALSTGAASSTQRDE